MLIKTLDVGHFGTNCYIVTDEATLECAIIDPGADGNTIMNYMEQNKLKPRAILLTHAHYDHIVALPQVKEETGVPIYMSKKDVGLRMAAMDPGFSPPEDTIFCGDGDSIAIGGLRFSVIETPGHTPGGLTFQCEDALFTGDTLFHGSCGRTDLPGGDIQQELRSLKRLADLSGDYEVYPGHMECSRLSVERNLNPYMRMAIENM